jgi:hypothetical protein
MKGSRCDRSTDESASAETTWRCDRHETFQHPGWWITRECGVRLLVGAAQDLALLSKKYGIFSKLILDEKLSTFLVI